MFRCAGRIMHRLGSHWIEVMPDRLYVEQSSKSCWLEIMFARNHVEWSSC